MRICHTIGMSVSAWTVAGTLAVSNTIDHTNSRVLVPWLIVALAVAITSTVSLKIWQAQAEVAAELREARGYDESPALSLVP